MDKRKIIHRDNDLRVGRWAEELAGGWETIDRLWTRRQMLKGSAALTGGAMIGSLLGATRQVLGDEAVKTGKFIFPRLQFAVSDETRDIWNVGPSGDVILRRKLAQLTNINVSMEPKVVRLGDFDELCRHPFVFMTSEGFFKLPDKEEKNLKEYLDRGGFILADDCVWRGKEDRFFRTYVELINRLFPDNRMRHIPRDHEIYHIYYDFPDYSPHMQGVRMHEGKPGAWGLFEPGTGRIMTYADPGDLHCGWMMRYWGGKGIHAIKMGVNIIIYFLSH